MRRIESDAQRQASIQQQEVADLQRQVNTLQRQVSDLVIDNQRLEEEDRTCRTLCHAIESRLVARIEALERRNMLDDRRAVMVVSPAGKTHT